MSTNVSTGTRPEALKAPAASYGGPLAILTTLFFMWGSLTSLNDVLIPYAQHVFDLSLAKSMLIQTAFFLAYFVFSDGADCAGNGHYDSSGSGEPLCCSTGKPQNRIEPPGSYAGL